MYRSITLEISLKPFKETTDEYIKEVCERAFEQWKALVRDSEIVKIMLWSADGSELLDYRGDIDAEFEWGYIIGHGNPKGDYPRHLDPEGKALHSTGYLYIENPPKMTYAILKKIVSEFKAAGERILPGKKIMVGTTFDSGPEFAKSEFKYKRHNEICKGNVMGKATMVSAYEKLNGDDVSYAGFPNGIPDQTPFGKFFGRQANVFMKDMGFDYIWFSNGLGFGREPWSATGAVFDGETFFPEKLEEISNDAKAFWELFREECPDFPIETRGTNMSMGIDYSTDGVPLKTIYNTIKDVLPPPNSPWAALDGDFGLEMMGHMSRIAHLATDDYLFRYYVHDPWWANSPWYDRYNSMPHDIYLPMALARVNPEGKVVPPSNLNLLSIDNCWGGMPYDCANEPTPHLRKACKQAPDDVAPVVWVYPFDEYSSATTEQELKEMYSGDWFIRGAINTGLPMTTVVTTTNFVGHDKEMYAASILVSAVPKAGTEYEKTIIEYVKNGGKVIFYGSCVNASESFKDLIGITLCEKGAEGEFEICENGVLRGKIKHNGLICGGEVLEKAKDGYEYISYGDYAGATKKGNCIWLRATVSANYVKGQKLLIPHKADEYFIGESLVREAVTKLGYEIMFECDKGTKLPVLAVHRNNNAFIYSAFLASVTVKTKFKTPFGAPVLDGYDTKLEDGYATYNFPKWEHKECRVFVEQNDGIVKCYEQVPGSVYFRRRVCVSGLKNATVRFFSEENCKDETDIKLNTIRPYSETSDEFEWELIKKDHLTYYEVKNVTGELTFSMPARGLSTVEVEKTVYDESECDQEIIYT
ncbi:MAG: hypothetical protein IJB70_11240 [Clostridia bacterium]|nr:hypothetical protein [Clostridia bacterium]